MSSDHQTGENTSATHGIINHASYLAKDIHNLCLSDDYSDISIKFGNECFKGHRIILAARSEYFRALLYGGLRESTQDEIEMVGANVESFKELLKYIYSGQLALSGLKEDVIVDLLGMAHLYGFQHLEKAISDYFVEALTTQNVFSIYDAARLYSLNSLVEHCKFFIDRSIPPIIVSSLKQFAQLTPEALKEIIERDSFYASEMEIFEIVRNWAVANNMKGTSHLENVLSAVRFELINLYDICGVVRPAGLVSADRILDAMEKRVSGKRLRYRGTMNVNVNMADPRWGTQVLKGEMRNALLDGNTLNYDMEHGYTRHSISEVGDCIIVQLGTQCIINHIRMLLWDKDLRSYCYYIELSIDEKDWFRVVDHTDYYCRSWQKLYFEPQAANYIKIVGTHNTVNTVFHVVALEAMYTDEPLPLVNGIIRPTQNVATTKESAAVIEGVCRSRNALLDGDFKVYDFNKGYTCHQIGSGDILVQLGQPYLINSMRLLLWDCDDRSYSYYIEVSCNRKEWEIVWNKRDAYCQSWQLITFPARPVVFIKIVGTRNTANEAFHCVYFECSSENSSEDRQDGESNNKLPSAAPTQPQSASTQSSTPSTLDNKVGRGDVPPNSEEE